MLAKRQIYTSLRTLSRSFAGKSFEEHASALQKLSERPGQNDMLKLYALYKQATVGPNTTPKPSAFDIVNKFKWQQWTDLGSMSKDEAEMEYIALCKRLGVRIESASAASSASPASNVSSSTTSSSTTSGDKIIMQQNENGVLTITLNRPEKRNALQMDMYKAITEKLTQANSDPSIRIVELTGNGNYYCSGNDLSNFLEAASNPEKFAEDSRQILTAFTLSLMKLDKILVIAVNGPAIGIATTTLPFADYVYASHKATFSAPLVGLGQTPEGGSSYTFPFLFGFPRAMKMLVNGHKLSAEEAAEWGLVTDVFLDTEFKDKVAEQVKMLSNLPTSALLASKKLMRKRMNDELLEKVVIEEGHVIKKAWLGPECAAAVAKFLSKK
jgi:Delta3-Delta2-enoyl-CoA isomerase